MTETSTKKPKVLYLYAGSRREFFLKWQKGLAPDTQLLGLNYMRGLGVDAEFLEWGIAERLRKINFNLVHLPYIFAIRRYDVVFICAGLPLVFLAKCVFGWKRPKFVIYNTFLTNALKRNPNGFLGHITRKAIENIDTIICTAKTQKDFLITKGFDEKKIVFTPIGIDAEKFSETAQNDSPKENYILSVGRDLGRDYATLFEAVRDLPIKVVVATKPEAIAGLSTPENVEVRFHVLYEEMPTLYARSLFAVIPLKDKNPSGSDTSGQYGFLEPMAVGKAVIVSDRTTVRDYIENGRDGILVPPENPTALRSAIENLLQNPDQANLLGKTAQRKVLDSFTGKKFAEKLAEIFKTLAS